MSVFRIRIGVYGATGAGKVRFFQQLVRENGQSPPKDSPLAAFMTTDDTAIIRNIEIKTGAAKLIVCDGNARHTASADAVMFFFDPGGGESKHFADERLRAKQLIDNVLKIRQNRLLPVVFVLTHRERWTPEQAQLAEEWISQVGDYLTETYVKTLRNHFPPPLVWKEHVFHTVSSADETQAGETLGVMDHVRKMTEFAIQFRRRDHRRSLGFVAFFILCMVFILGIPYLGFTSPTVRQVLGDFRDRLALILHLPIGLATPEEKINLDPLFNGVGELTESEARTLNRSLFLLMKKLNKFEDDDQPATDDDLVAVELWNRAAETTRDRFAKDTAPNRLERYGILLNGLLDTPKRQPRILNEMLKDYWTAYRTRLLDELRQELAVQREANTPSTKILSELCVQLETAFRDVTESGVRSDAASGTNDETRKESLKQDIRKAYIACRNYIDRVPLEVVVVSVSLESTQEIDRDIYRRLTFSGGLEKGEVFNDLTISTGFQNREACDFLPARKEFTLSFVPDRSLRVAVQGKPKGTQDEWSDIAAWDLTPPSSEISLVPLGIPFYQKFENEENTAYSLSAEGYKLELTVRRPRNVPELLWEIVEETAAQTQSP